MSLVEAGQYRIVNEDGPTIIGYHDLLASPLIEQIRDFVPTYGRNVRTGLILGRTIFTYDKKYLIQNPAKAEMLADLEHEQITNPIQFWAPSGEGVLNFINDLESKICMLIAPNQAGKTNGLLIKAILGMVPANKSWPIFEEHGVRFRKPIRELAGIGSYKWSHINEVLMPELLKWMPLDTCTELIAKWRGGGGRSRAWDQNSTLMLESGSGIRNHAYTQDQTAFESAALKAGWFWDEQPLVERWNGANERIRTSRSAQHNHGLTPHRVPGMEEVTGAGTFLHDIYEGTDLRGYMAHQVKRYTITRMDEVFNTGDISEANSLMKALKAGKMFCGGEVPDWIMPEASKIEAYEQHIVGPLNKRDTEALQRGRSRVFGGWERSEVMMVPSYDETIHVIDAFPIPYNFCTLYRYYDHGRINPACALWGAVPRPGGTFNINGEAVTFPDDESILIIFREYYQGGLPISDHAKNVVLASGNKLVDDGRFGKNDRVYKRYKERYTNESYQASKGDMGSLNKPSDVDGNMTIQDVYRNSGLNLQKTNRKYLHASDGSGSIEITREWFRIDTTRPHPFYKDTMGFSKIYIFSGCVNLRRQLRELVDPLYHSGREQEDHAFDPLRYMLHDAPRYVEGSSLRLDDEEEDEENLDNSPRRVFRRGDGYSCY